MFSKFNFETVKDEKERIKIWRRFVSTPLNVFLPHPTFLSDFGI
jgi:hypothetical protein